jgi:hypothetical protein
MIGMKLGGLAVVFFIFTISLTIMITPADAQDIYDCEENETISCGSNIGECSPGYRECIGGLWGDCKGEIGPKSEICDNKVDDDCDGLIDECGNFMWMVLLGIGLLLFGGGIAVANQWTD